MTVFLRLTRCSKSFQGFSGGAVSTHRDLKFKTYNVTFTLTLLFNFCSDHLMDLGCSTGDLFFGLCSTKQRRKSSPGKRYDIVPVA